MSVLASLLSFVLLYKYDALALIVYISALILPLPANAMLLAIGAFASRGYFNFWVALAVAVLANTAGDLTGYGIARRYGERVTRILRLHKLKFYEQLKEELRTDAAITVFMTRFAGSLSTIGNFLAGLVFVPLKTFLVNDMLGNVIEPFAALTFGYVAGDYWGDLSGFFGIVTAIVALVVIIFVLSRIKQRIAARYR